MFPGHPSDRRKVFSSSLLAHVCQGREFIEVSGASEEELDYLQLVLIEAREGHSNLLPLNEQRLKVCLLSLTSCLHLLLPVKS